jgi:TonB family protein
MDWVVPELTVVLTDTQTNKQWKNRTDSAGHYTFSGLRDGEYVLEIERTGFESLREEVSIVGPEVQHDVKLRLGSATEEMLVTTDSWSATPLPVRALTRHRVPKGKPPQCSAESIANRIGGRIVLPRKTGHVNPTYPAEAIVARQQGRTRVEGVISSNGSMTRVTILESTSVEFARAVSEAVSLWEFDPKYLNCNPVDTPLTVTVSFRKQ